MFRVLSSLFLFVFSVSAAAGADWADALFAVREHHFGTVAVGTKAEYRFEFTNPYDEDIRLLSVSSSCSCTLPKLSAAVVPAGQRGAVIAAFNTSGQHLYDRYATLTVRLHRKSAGTEAVLFSVDGFIYPDIMFRPQNVDFGSLPQGQAKTQVLQLEYTGSKRNWAITGIDRTQPFVYAKAENIQDGKKYRITVELRSDAPAGYVKDVLQFKTNEPVNNVISLPVQAYINAPMVVKPLPIVLVDGDSAKNIVLRSATPFEIVNVQSDTPQLHFTYPQQKAEIQIVSVNYVKERDTEHISRPAADIHIQYRTNAATETLAVQCLIE